MIPVEPPVRKKLESAPGAPEQVQPGDSQGSPPGFQRELPQGILPEAAAAVPEQDFQEPMPGLPAVPPAQPEVPDRPGDYLGFPAGLMVLLAYPAESQRECPGFVDP